MGNLVGLDLFLEVETDGDPRRYYYSPAAQTQMHGLNSRKGELITSSSHQPHWCQFSERKFH